MPQLILQLALLIAVVFIIGSLLGSFARKRKAKHEPDISKLEKPVEAIAATPDKPEAAVEEAAKTEPDAAQLIKAVADDKAPVKTDTAEQQEAVAEVPAVEKTAAMVAEPVAVEEQIVAEEAVIAEPEPVIEKGVPERLEAARNGKADDLMKIKGIGPTLQRKLNTLGIYHYDQLLAWDAENAIWIGRQLNFPGRVEREDWIEQAKALAKLKTKEQTDKAPKKPSAKKAPTAKRTVKASAAKSAVKKSPVKSKAKAPAKKTNT